jgi:two-component system, OmpR family, sensor histidine kinase KdpD
MRGFGILQVRALPSGSVCVRSQAGPGLVAPPPWCLELSADAGEDEMRRPLSGCRLVVEVSPAAQCAPIRTLRRDVDAMLLRGRRPSQIMGLVTTVVLVGVCTGLIYPLERVTTVSSLGVVYLLGVVVVSAYWGVWFGLGMSVLSAAAFNFFHLPPILRFTIADTRNWVALGAFLVVAVATSTVSELARARAVEADQRRAEADLTAEMAQMLLARAGVRDALVPIGRRLAADFGLAWGSVRLDEQEGDERHVAIPLLVGERRVGTLMVPAGLRAGRLARLRERVAPALAAVLEVGLSREELVAEAVQTEALRRSDAAKTAVLRAVSHDLRSPVTAMVAAGAAVRAPEVTLAERDELGGLVVEEGARLSRLIDDLLDLSRLEAQTIASRPMECSVEEVIDAALAAQPRDHEFDVRIDPSLGLVRADFAQVERALANLLENASRYANGSTVTVRARAVGDRAAIRVIDRGPGISPIEQTRIFEPFYRAPGADDAHTGSGLGLAIAKGFIETNGGSIRVESILGQGTSFVVELPGVEPVRH